MSALHVKVPKKIEPLFENAEEYVARYFSRKKESPEKGTITIGGERYILVRAASMSVHFFEYIKTLNPNLENAQAVKSAGDILYNVGRAAGKADARVFIKAMDVGDPIAKLSSGPIHFSYAGWAFVDISEESRPLPNENYYLLYDHPQSFEADSWMSMEKSPDFCVCFMNAGYSSSWCEVSFGIDLVAKEILCRAKGDKYCRFIMAPPNMIDGYIKEYKDRHPELFSGT
ncbi:MAG: XylR N-terminal domain-containing protein [Candidatus Omnitrophica bacterium]|nr:XylR N-terminal domain-containing protein [Candidatus Omnitrophota bacterium]